MLEIVARACNIVGGPQVLADHLGCTRQALYQWNKVPRGRAFEIEVATGGQITRHEIRPDLFPVTAEAP